MNYAIGWIIIPFSKIEFEAFNKIYFFVSGYVKWKI